MTRFIRLSLCLTASLLACSLAAQQPLPPTTWALDSSTLTYQLCMVRRTTARVSLGEKTSLRKCIRPSGGDRLSWPG